MGAEAAKRSIQSAMGRYNASVGKSDSQVKSGVAIKALDTQSDQGSFHFIDAYDTALEFAGRVLNDLIDVVDNAAKDVAIRKQDESHSIIRINEPFTDDTGQQQHIQTGVGDHDVTISTGPSYQSQREEATGFVDVLVQNLATLPLDPQTKAQLLGLAIKLKNLGPIGDQMADIISPQQGGPIPPQAQAAMAQMQQQNQVLTQAVQQMREIIQTKFLEVQAKIRVAEINKESAITVQGMKGDIEFLRQEVQSIETRLAMLHEAELAPNPASGPEGLHPDQPQPQPADGQPQPPAAT
jgi:hypothetical protein